VDAAAESAASFGLDAPSGPHRAPHMIGIRSERGFPPAVAQALAAEGIHVSVRGGALRISPHLYNTTADPERLFTTLRRHLKEGPSRT